jgi:5-methylcytosine-specific restriction protein A
MFDIGKIYSRAELHKKYGGQEQGGISTPADHPLILLFTGSAGHKYGYTDDWEENHTVFRFYGEGQQGDMQFTRGNTAVRDHAANGKEIHLFSADGRGRAIYLGQMICAGYEMQPNVPDRNGKPRRGIVFRLVPLNEADPDSVPPNETDASKDNGATPKTRLWTMPLDELLALAQQGPAPTTEPRKVRVNARERSEAVKIFVQRRANGICEGCHAPAPFSTAEGRPYLEPHHTRHLSDAGLVSCLL